MAEAVRPARPGSETIMLADTSTGPATLMTGVDREVHDWLTLFAGGNATEADLTAFKRWSERDPAHVDAFGRACLLWEAIGQASVITTHSRSSVSRHHSAIPRRAFLGGALAASAAGAAYVAAKPPLGLWPSLSELAADYRTAPGEQRTVTLVGGPSVDMNTRTSIVLRTLDDNNAERIELISGEATVATRHEMLRAVEIVAGNGHVTATDAVFNIRYEDNNACTTCVSGGLLVTAGDRSAHLYAGEQIVYSASGLGAVAEVDATVVTAWRDGVLVFQSTPLAEAVAEINRYRPGKIIMTNANLGRRLFNARFPIASIGGVVAQIQHVFGASVTTLPGGIVLLG